MGEYEFTEEENKYFTSATFWMRLCAILIIAGGIGTIVNFDFDLRFMSLFAGIVYIVLGSTFWFPTGHLARIVSTEGSDITELMTAFDKIQKGWLIANILTLARVVLMIISIGLVISGSQTTF